ncbi:MAG: hypothetical protein ACRC4U_07005, partial [Shewanella sp.]
MADYDDNNPSWLSGQLTPEKQKSEMWRGFAHALQAIFDEHILPTVDRLAGLNSYFTMHTDDLAIRIKELGSFFYFGGSVEADDMPLAVMQKLDEIHFKRTDLPLKNAISREMGGMKVEWEPLYAPKVLTPAGNKDYSVKWDSTSGTLINALLTAREMQQLGESMEDYFITSRGVISVSSSSLSRSGHTSDEFTQLIQRIITPIIPLDIVYDGERIVIHYDIIEPLERLFANGSMLTEDFKALIESTLMITGGYTEQKNTANNALAIPPDYRH